MGQQDAPGQKALLFWGFVIKPGLYDDWRNAFFYRGARR
jgi:hypothetical protein